MIANVIEGVGLGVVAGAAMVYAWVEPKIAELRDALGDLPHLYAEALEDIETLDAENAQLHGELDDAREDLACRDQVVDATLATIDERQQEHNANVARLCREAEMRVTADRMGVKHRTVAELLDELA